MANISWAYLGELRHRLLNTASVIVGMRGFLEKCEFKEKRRIIDLFKKIEYDLSDETELMWDMIRKREEEDEGETVKR